VKRDMARQKKVARRQKISRVTSAPVTARASGGSALGIIRQKLLLIAAITAKAIEGVRKAFLQMSVRRTCKNLRVCETVPLGEKRFVAIVEAVGERFLIGGTANSLAVLARLREQEDGAIRFAPVLQQFGGSDLMIQ
jgi:flagellar biogenesis protein FliO